FMYLLYDLPIQKVLRHPVNIACIFQHSNQRGKI
ncbi:hypothetical protein ACN38_g13054, partial [Penicillium nordicum]